MYPSHQPGGAAVRGVLNGTGMLGTVKPLAQHHRQTLGRTKIQMQICLGLKSEFSVTGLYSLWLWVAGQRRQDAEDSDLGPSRKLVNLSLEQREEAASGKCGR